MVEVHKPRAPWTIPLAESPVSPWADRAFAVLFAVPAVVCTVALASVNPDARGHGTHEQLGMEPCSWPILYGAPCPTCGCTTAACQLVHGRVLSAFVTQPFGAAMAFVGLLLGVHAIACLLRRRSFVDVMVRMPFWRAVSGGILLLLLSWGYKYLTWPA